MKSSVDQVHHYCSPNVFLSLVRHGEFWLTSLTQSNDQLVGTWMLQYWLQKFNARDRKDRLLRNGSKLLVEGVMRENVALGTCFSEERDLLSQWRGYASDGAGFSVTFDAEMVRQLRCSRSPNLPLHFSRVHYGGYDIEQVNDEVHSMHMAFGEEAKNYDESDDGFGLIAQVMSPERSAKQREAVRRLFTVKNGAFREEKEWRLFVYDSPSAIGSVEFRESRGVISPFLRAGFPKQAIVGVTLGPTNRTSVSMIKSVLQAYGVEAWVKSSTASYRLP